MNRFTFDDLVFSLQAVEGWLIFIFVLIVVATLWLSALQIISMRSLRKSIYRKAGRK